MAVAVNYTLTEAARLLNDLTNTRWPEAELLDWLNEGLRELAVRYLDAKVTRTSVTLVAGAKQTLPSGAITLHELRTSTGGAIPFDKPTMDRFSQTWQSDTDSTVRQVSYNPAEHPVFWVYPAQNTTPATVELVCPSYPASAVVGGNLDVQDKYAAKLVDYILYRALSKDAEVGSAERAVAYHKSFYA